MREGGETEGDAGREGREGLKNCGSEGKREE